MYKGKLKIKRRNERIIKRSMYFLGVVLVAAIITIPLYNVTNVKGKDTLQYVTNLETSAGASKAMSDTIIIRDSIDVVIADDFKLYTTTAVVAPVDKDFVSTVSTFISDCDTCVSVTYSVQHNLCSKDEVQTLYEQTCVKNNNTEFFSTIYSCDDYMLSAYHINDETTYVDLGNTLDGSYLKLPNYAKWEYDNFINNNFRHNYYKSVISSVLNELFMTERFTCEVDSDSNFAVIGSLGEKQSSFGIVDTSARVVKDDNSLTVTLFYDNINGPDEEVIYTVTFSNESATVPDLKSNGQFEEFVNYYNRIKGR